MPHKFRRGLILVVLAALAPVTASCEQPGPVSSAAAAGSGPMSRACAGPAAFVQAAAANAASLSTLVWEPFRRQEVGWEAYVPVVAREIGATCPPQSPAFAAALARWQGGRGLPPDGLFSPAAFTVIKGLWQERRPFVMATLDNQCPDAPDEASLVPALVEEGYGGKPVWLRPGALDAYRGLRDAARAEAPQLLPDSQALTLFSGYRSPAADESRCLAEGNCQGITRARCSAHRTGLAIDLNLGAAPGYRPDNAADENRLFISRTPLYAWLLANAGRFGFVNYIFEPWHWEWTGEPPLPMSPGTIWPPQPLSSGDLPPEPAHDLAIPQPVPSDPGRGLQPRSAPGAAAPADPHPGLRSGPGGRLRPDSR